jgi:hypothetical protein
MSLLKKTQLAFVLALAISVGGCKCAPAARQAAQEIEDTQKIVLPEYKSYVEKDASLDADKKDRRKKLVESLERLVEKLKKALEE